MNGIYLVGVCVLCHDVMEFLPGLAPTSESLEGVRGEICKKCHESCEAVREEMELDAIPVPDNAYREIAIQ